MSVYDDLWAVLAAPGYFMLHIEGTERWISVTERRSFERTLGGVATLGERAWVLPVPRYDFSRVAVGDSAVLWVRAEKRDEAAALLSWSPKPTFIFQEGSTVRHTALWALSDKLDPRWTHRLNKRLAHAIGTAKKHADPENFHFTPPGAKDDTGKVSTVVHAEPTYFSARALVGNLPDAPDPKAYLKRREALAA